MKKQKGITLIALLVTVSVLTILVAVAISAVENDDIISGTKKSASDFELAQEKENLQRVVLGWAITESDTLVNHLKEKYGEDKVQANVDESITVEVESGNKYIVTEDGEVTLLDGTIEEPETTPDTELVISVALDKTTITKEIESGSTATETLTATLTNATGTLTWTSSNTTVATVSGSGSTGTVTLKAAGSATITVSYGSYSATCKVTVTEAMTNTDTSAPTITITSAAESVSAGNMKVDIELSNVSDEDYPITIEYYYKLASASDDSYVKSTTQTITTGTTDSYTYSLSTSTSYMLRVVVIDNTGNSSYVEKTAGTSCFLAGTLILTETGMKNIEDIKVGDKVYSINLDNNQRELKEVIRLFKGTSDETYEITIGNEVIKTTPKHQFYVIDKGWVRAYELEEGDQISSTEEELVITKIEHKFHEVPVQVYNLTVEDYHNYLITKYELLVHNKASPVG